MNISRRETHIPESDFENEGEGEGGEEVVSSRSIRAIRTTDRGTFALGYSHRGTRDTAQKISKIQKTDDPGGGAPFPLGKRPAIAYHTRIPDRGGRTMMSLLMKQIIIFIVILVSSALASAYFFGHAEVIVEPTLYAAPITKTLTLYNKSASSTDIVYETMEMTRSLSATLPVTSTRMVEGRASGEITIFNTTNQVQEFREETRFASPDGLIFKLPKGGGITVPAGSTEKPGSFTTTVYAEKSGSSYNIGLVDWTIPGWKEIGDPRYTTQYARSKTVMTGGDQHEEATIDPEVLTTTLAKLDAQIVSDIATQCATETPAHLLCISRLIELSFSDPVVSTSTSAEKTTSITRSATAKAYLLPKDQMNTQMINHIVANTTLDEDHPFMQAREHITILSADYVPVQKFTHNLSSDTSAHDTTSLEIQKDSVTVYLNGVITFVYEPNYTAVKNALRGQRISGAEVIFKATPAIHTASVTIQPLWKLRFPKNPDQIDITPLFPESTFKIGQKSSD